MKQLDQEQKNALCAAVRTSGYAKKVVSLLRDMAEDLYRTDQQAKVVNIEAFLDEELSVVVRSILSGVDTSNPMEMEQALRAVITYIKEVEEINFVVPVHPKKEFAKRLFDWCAGNIKPEIFIEFTTNRLMESGLLMIYKGRYLEYSLENLLNDYMSSHDLGSYFDRAVAASNMIQQPSDNNNGQVGSGVSTMATGAQN